jgi:hypothetical protein
VFSKASYRPRKSAQWERRTRAAKASGRALLVESTAAGFSEARVIALTARGVRSHDGQNVAAQGRVGEHPGNVPVGPCNIGIGCAAGSPPGTWPRHAHRLAECRQSGPCKNTPATLVRRVLFSKARTWVFSKASDDLGRRARRIPASAPPAAPTTGLFNEARSVSRVADWLACGCAGS